MSVIRTVTVSQMVDDLMSDEYAAWSYAGANAIAEYYENLSDDIGEPIEWDRVAVRCEFSEYTLRDILDNFGDSLNLNWAEVVKDLVSYGEFPVNDLIEELKDQFDCVIHVDQGKNPMPWTRPEDTFIISKLDN